MLMNILITKEFHTRLQFQRLPPVPQERTGQLYAMALVAAEPMKHSLCTGDRLDHKDDPAEKNMEQKAPSSSFQPIHRVIGRSVTLGHNSRLAVEGHGRSSEFTRVKRLNTLHCLIRTPPRRTVAAVIQPLHTKQGATVSCSAPPAVPVGAFMEPASPDEHTHTPVQDSVLEFEVQEATMELHSSQSSSSSLHSDSTTSPSSPSFCSVCHEDFWPSDTVVLFGELSLHLGCFQCGSCKCSMGAVSQFLIQTSGAPLCLSCCPTCHSCKEKILRNHVAVLNKDFHEQCLVCSHCQRVSHQHTHTMTGPGQLAHAIDLGTCVCIPYQLLLVSIILYCMCWELFVYGYCKHSILFSRK